MNVAVLFRPPDWYSGGVSVDTSCRVCWHIVACLLTHRGVSHDTSCHVWWPVYWHILSCRVWWRVDHDCMGRLEVDVSGCLFTWLSISANRWIKESNSYIVIHKFLKDPWTKWIYTNVILLLYILKCMQNNIFVFLLFKMNLIWSIAVCYIIRLVFSYVC